MSEERSFLISEGQLRAIFRELAAQHAVLSVARQKEFNALVENEGILDIDGLLSSVKNSPPFAEWIESNFPSWEKLTALTDLSRFEEQLAKVLLSLYPSTGSVQ